MCGIYKITNTINGKCYIGQSIDIAARLAAHKNLCPSNYEYDSPLHQDIRAFGLNNFTFEILEECSIENLNKREIYWISQFHSFDSGYNQTRGGSGKLKYDYNLLCTEWENSDYNGAAFARSHNLSQRTVSIIAELADLPLKGNKRNIYQYSLDGNLIQKFDSIVEAHKWCFNKGLTAVNIELQGQSSHISACANKTRKMAYGYIWSYTELNETEIAERVKMINEDSPYVAKIKKRIQCIETGKVYDSITAAGKELKVNKGQISRTIDNPKRTCHGFHFISVT